MTDVTEWALGTLAIVLAGAAFIVGGQVIRDAWRGMFKRPRSGPSRGAGSWERPSSATATPASEGPAAQAPERKEAC